MSDIMYVQQQLGRVLDQINTRNDILRKENEIQTQAMSLQAQNELYDDINVIIKPQVDRIETLIDKKEMNEITFLLAYIKRRSNLEIISRENNIMPLEELNLSISESMSCAELCGIQGAVHCQKEVKTNASLIIRSYEVIQHIMETNLANISNIVVYVETELDRLIMRVMIETREKNTFISEGVFDWLGERDVCRTATEESGVMLTIEFEEGGDNR